MESTQQRAFFSIRILEADFYTCKPSLLHDESYSTFRSRSTARVPVIRIFGVTPAGQKACAHIHGVYPYFYIPWWKESLPTPGELREFAASLDQALHRSQQRESAQSSCQVAAVEAVVKNDFYGYHHTDDLFLKISLYSPFILTKAADVVQGGLIDGQQHQPYEAHIPFMLQFMTDFNLQGMNFIHSQDASFRDPLPDLADYKAGLDVDPSNRIFTRNNVPDGKLYEVSGRAAKCALEVDIKSDDILNVHDAVRTKQSTDLPANPGLVALWEDERLRRRARGESTAFTQSTAVPRASPDPTLATANEQYYTNLLKQAITTDSELAFSGLVSKPPLSQGAIPFHDTVEHTTQQTMDALLDALASQPELKDCFGEDGPNAEDDQFSQLLKLQDELEDLEESTIMSQVWTAEREQVLEQAVQHQDIYPDEDSKLVRAEQDDSQGDNLSQAIDSDIDSIPDSLPASAVAQLSSDDQLDTTTLGLFRVKSNAEVHTQPLHKSNALFAASLLSPVPERCTPSPPTPTSPTCMQQPLRITAKRPAILSRPGPLHPSKRSPIKASVPKLPSAETPKPSAASLLRDSTPNKGGLTALSPSRPRIMVPTSSNFSPTRSASGQEGACKWYRFSEQPPSPASLTSLHQHGLPNERHVKPFYSKVEDRDAKARSLSGLRNSFLPPIGDHLQDFSTQISVTDADWKLVSAAKPRRVWLNPYNLHYLTPARQPPARLDVEDWLTKLRDKRQEARVPVERAVSMVRSTQGPGIIATGSSVGSTLPSSFTPMGNGSAQIAGPTAPNTFKFKMKTQNVSEATKLQTHQHITAMSMELHADSKGFRESDPRQDPIVCIVYSLAADDFEAPVGCLKKVLYVKGEGEPDLARLALRKYQGVSFEDEMSLVTGFLSDINDIDPDVLIGYEVQLGSWGYLFERGGAIGVDIAASLSRLYDTKSADKDKADPHGYFARHTSELNVKGRVLLNVWRLLRHEVALTSYTFESTMFHILHLRVPKFKQSQLRDWYSGPSYRERRRTLQYLGQRVEGTLQLIYELNLIERTSEFARLFGILFSEVITRGSQFRVESIMVRIAHAKNQIMLSPSKQQVRDQKAPAALPLILEPQSAFYTNPVIVLDFQSLYPSMMIAYNMCYSTCLGRVQKPEKMRASSTFPFGVAELTVPPGLLSSLAERDLVHICPNGTMFVKKEARLGVLPVMLDEILRTRIMVKKAMKGHQPGEGMHRLMNARQLGLKLIANVTYGYTSASFSGRMPCIDIADSIVQQGRETLTKAMRMVESNTNWNAKVVYGDTDSMFIMLPGASKADAFRIGREIAAEVTAANPDPVKLKFEKVYLPCILQTKKRYVGFMYEHEDQVEPVFEAKGIETVRRDFCPAVAKTLEKSLRLLFTTKDVSLVKEYLTEQWLKVLMGKVNLADFIFAKEYRGRESYSEKACVAALEIANKLSRIDPRAEPRVRQRVPYVIVCGPPKATLISLVRQPHELLHDPSLRLNALYYIRKQIIPPLERCFNLLGVKILPWYLALPKIQRVAQAITGATGTLGSRHKTTISQFYQSAHCIVCDELTRGNICDDCQAAPQRSIVTINARIQRLETRQQILQRICARCTKSWDGAVECVSLNCPVYFERTRLNQQLAVIAPHRDLDF